MSIHSSLKGVDTLSGERSVLTRFERIQKLTADGKLDAEEASAYGLPKVRTKFKVAKAKKKAAETDADAAATEGEGEGEGEAPACRVGAGPVGGPRTHGRADGAPRHPEALERGERGGRGDGAGDRFRRPRPRRLSRRSRARACASASRRVFVRLAGCPLRCLWCDTPESWAADGGAEVLDAPAARAPGP